MARSVDNPNDFLRSQNDERPQVVLNATEARQGSWGKPVFYVLIIGLLLAFAAWGIAEFYGSEIAPDAKDPATTSSTVKDPAANQKMIDNNQPAGQPVEKSPAIQDSTKL